MSNRSLLWCAFFLGICGCISLPAHAQQLQLKSYTAGYRVLEISPVGGDPRTLWPLMKDANAYRTFTNTFQYSGYALNGGGNTVTHALFINGEFYNRQSDTRFWKRHTIQAGIYVTTPRKNYGATLQNNRWPDDTTYAYDRYQFKQTIQFAGLNIGINRRSNLTKRLQFVTGLHAQVGAAVKHHYTHYFDTSLFKPSTGLQTTITPLPDIKGKHFLQWQAMVPLGLEWALHKQKIALRADLNIGVVGYRFNPSGLRFQYANGAGLWLVYKLH